jgi:hypothetical protein
MNIFSRSKKIKKYLLILLIYNILFCPSVVLQAPQVLRSGQRFIPSHCVPGGG